MTQDFDHGQIESPRAVRGPEAWLVGAFLVLFSVAVSSAMPAIAAAVRTAAADAAGGASSESFKIRVVVRTEQRSVRSILPQVGGDVGLPPEAVFPPIFESRPTVALHDRGALFRALGFNARAPPLTNA